MKIVLVLLMLFTFVSPIQNKKATSDSIVSEKRDSFIEAIDNSYSGYNITEYKNSFYDVIVIEGLCNNENAPRSSRSA